MLQLFSKALFMELRPTCSKTRPAKRKKQKKTKSRKQICPEITVNSPGNPCSKYLSRKKGRATVGKVCREGRFGVVVSVIVTVDRKRIRTLYIK